MIRAARFLFPTLAFVLLCGCPGQLRDYIGPRSSIIRPQLIRFGFSLPEVACVSNRLGETLRPRQLRFLTRGASYLQRPFRDSDRFSPLDFLQVARGLQDQQVQVEVRHAYDACHVQLEPVQVAAPTPAPAPAPAEAAPRQTVWLNLGAASSGQAIAVDGASLEQEDTTRTAWFRMIDPPPAGPSVHAYRLRIDCRTRIIRPLGHRLYDQAGAVTQEQDYAPEEQLPSPVEGGTVTEIAYLSLCT